MPRTKVSKTSKRNREAALREDKIRDFEAALDGYVTQLYQLQQAYLSEVENELKVIAHRNGSTLLKLPIREVFNLEKFSDWTPKADCLSVPRSVSQSMSDSTISTVVRPTKSSNPNDEGYLTEDSTGGSTNGTQSAFTSITTAEIRSQTTEQLRGRTPGPLNSARARRPRRSRSASGDIVPILGVQSQPSIGTVYIAPLKTSTDLSERVSRNKLRTPAAARTKAYSADRTPKVIGTAPTAPQSPPTAFMRWPKPGEMVLSLSGSPVVAQVMPDKFANVNIPVKNGVLSLRPKKLSELRPDIIEAIDPVTLNQIKTLHANLNFIVNMADKATTLK